MDNLFWFCRNYRLRQFFYEDTRADNDTNTTVYNKTQEKKDMPKQLENRSTNTFYQILSKINFIKKDIINFCNKQYINHQ